MRIELDGDWAEVYPTMIHKTNRALNTLIVKALGENYQAFHDKVNNAKTIEEKQALWKALPLENDDEIILLNQVKEWSFGKVDQETLDHIDSVKYNQLLVEVNRLYSQPPLVRR